MTTDKGLGRRHAPDERDCNYLLRTLQPAAAPRRTRHWRMFAAPLDQGNTGTCVGHAWAHWMRTAPVIRRDKLDPFTIYREACALDPWTENDHGDLQFGTAVRAGAQALKARGHLITYAWAFDVGAVVDWLVSSGPIVLGTDWTDGMFRTDRDGFLEPAGRSVGGHAYTAVGYSEERGAIRFVNSWGGDFGERGRFWMTVEDVDELLSRDGEACTALEVRA